MPSLKDLKVRINSVKSTQKITSAMKMVAAAKLRRAQDQAMASRPYAERMERVLASLAAAAAGRDGAPALLAGTGKDQVHLLVVMTSDRGLCGAFNSSIVRQARRMARDLKREGKTLKILCVGRKGRDQLRREFAQEIIGSLEGVGKPKLKFEAADQIAKRIRHMFEHGEFDVCTVIYNRFKSAMTQIVTPQQLIPFAPPAVAAADTGGAVYEFEPEEEEILTALLPNNLAVQIFAALLESSASEHGARMTAMDSATRNAGDMINRLTITYNRTRQAVITKELIEIVSGAEAL
jgi:F-type H+-transporting ATPase subunit gamma